MVFTVYDLEKKGTSGGECYGTNDGTTASGLGFTNSCIHSGSYGESGSDTVWYNYVVATASTITGTGNTTNATQSICPKGWTLPARKQINIIGVSSSGGSTTYIESFSPTLGGYYSHGSLQSTSGFWWSSEANSHIQRYYIRYNGSDLRTLGDAGRDGGIYIRCVSEEKDVSDLTYMQDMTPGVATFAAEETTSVI